MRYVLLFIGAGLILYSLINGGRYIADYDSLTDYGKGFIWGNLLFFALGSALVIIGLVRRRKS